MLSPRSPEEGQNGERRRSHFTGSACSEASQLSLARENGGRVGETAGLSQGQAGLSRVLAVLSGSRHYSHRLLWSVQEVRALCGARGGGCWGLSDTRMRLFVMSVHNFVSSADHVPLLSRHFFSGVVPSRVAKPNSWLRHIGCWCPLVDRMASCLVVLRAVSVP